jgi:hypothetical protein
MARRRHPQHRHLILPGSFHSVRIDGRRLPRCSAGETVFLSILCQGCPESSYRPT